MSVLEELGLAANKIMPFKVDDHRVHPKLWDPVLQDEPQHDDFDTSNPNFDLYAKRIREGIRKFRQTVKKAKQVSAVGSSP